jgi:uncharacterized protein (TIGR03435 family)
LPRWATEDFYEIEAKAEGNPTKDQLRLMMQALLADRFKLPIHFETNEVPVFALTLVTPGKTGSKLRPHSEGPACPESFTQGSVFQPPPGNNDTFPPNCEVTERRPNVNGTSVFGWLLGARNTTMPLLASALSDYGRMAKAFDRPVLDKTGLGGRFDFTIEYAMDDDLSEQMFANTQYHVSVGPTFVEAVREQLGLKLERSRGEVRTLIIDHVERPSEN